MEAKARETQARFRSKDINRPPNEITKEDRFAGLETLRRDGRYIIFLVMLKNFQESH